MCRRASLKALSVFLRILTRADRLHLRGDGYFRDPQYMFYRVCIGLKVIVDIYKLEFTYIIVVHLCNAIWLTERGVAIKIYGRLS